MISSLPPLSHHSHENGHPAATIGTSNGHTNGYVDGYMPINISGKLSTVDRALLESGSGIDPKVIAARGYFTTDDKSILKNLNFAPRQCLTPGVLFPLCDVRGSIAGYQFRPQIPRRDKNNKIVKYEVPANSKPVLDVSPHTRHLVADVTVPLYITEGIKKGDAGASRGLCVIALSAGVYGFRDKKTLLPDWESIPLQNRIVYIVFDSDASQNIAVETAMRRLAQLLQWRGAIVKIVSLPDGPNCEKTGLDDFFVRGGTVNQLPVLARDLEGVDEARRRRKSEGIKDQLGRLVATGLPVIETNNQQCDDELNALSDAIEQANAASPRLFHGPNGMVSMALDNNGQCILEPVSREQLQSYAAGAAKWIRTSEREGVRNVAPPRDLCAAYLADKHRWRGIKPIDGIVTSPMFDANGDLCEHDGYNEQARLWLALNRNAALPDTTPTPSNVEAAKNIVLHRLLGEVAFADAASRAHAVALILLPFVRHMIDGPTPLHLFDAPTQSSGKTYAAKVCIAPFSNPKPSADKNDDEEWRKAILSACLSGRLHIFLDNIKSRLSSPMLATCITEDTVTERALGGLGEVTVSTRRVWVATSNNAVLDSDTVSRCVTIRLDTQMENPEGRAYSHDPLQYIRENRSVVHGAVITLVRHWQQQERPLYKGDVSRFKTWARIIGGILQSAEIPGFLENTDVARDNLDPEMEAWREFIGGWWERFGKQEMTAQQLLPIALTTEDLAATLDDGKGQAKSFGWMLRNRRDTVIAGFKITRAKQDARNGAKWQLLPVSNSKTVSNFVITPEKQPESTITAGFTGFAGFSPTTCETSQISELKPDLQIKHKNNWVSHTGVGHPAKPVKPAVDHICDEMEEI